MIAKNLLTKHGSQHLASRIVHESPHLVARDSGCQRDDIGLRRDPQDENRDDRRGGCRQSADRKSSRSRLWKPLGHRVPRGDVPGDEHRNLRHHPIGKPVRRRKMRDVFQRIQDEASFVDFGPTVIAITNMGLQGCYPEAHLVIEEEIDLVWKKVPMVHWVSGGLYGGWIALVSRPG